MARDGETARFAGISDLAAEKVIVQETGRQAGGSARKVVCNALKMHREAEGGSWAWLEVSRQGGHLDIRQGFRVLIWTLIVNIGTKMHSGGQGGEVDQGK